MYPSSELTRVPGGYIVQSKIEDDDGDIGIELVVFTSMEGVMGYLQSYFSDWESERDSDSDGEGETILTRD